MNFLKWRPNLSNWLKFAVVFTVVNLHSLRHLSVILFLVLYVPVVLYVTVKFLSKVRKDPHSGRWMPLLVLLSVALLGTVTSLILISLSGAALGLSRFLFALPVLFALYLYTDSLQTLRKHLITFAVFFTIASLSLPLQILTGPILWFAASSERADLQRYSSLLGSLTAFGIVVGSYFVLIQAFRPSLRLLAGLALVVSAVVSLSKAALVNVGLAILVLLFLNRRAWRKISIGASALLVIGIAVYYFVPVVKNHLDVSLVSFGLGDGTVVNYDTSLFDSAFQRLTQWPLANFEALSHLGNPLVYVFGGSFGMANTALVYQSDVLAPMAHNQYAEAITTFGFLGGGALIASMIVILLRLFRLYRRTHALEFQLVLLAYLFMLINSLFANGTLYQPANASIYYLALFLATFGHLYAKDSIAEVADLREPRHQGRLNIQPKRGLRSMRKYAPLSALAARLLHTT